MKPSQHLFRNCPRLLGALVVGAFVWGNPVTTHAITVTLNNDPNTLVNSLLGPGVNLVSITSSQLAPGSSGTFSGGLSTGPSGQPSGLGFDSGIILSTGRADLAPGPNFNQTDFPGAFDGDLNFDNQVGGDANLNQLLAQLGSPGVTQDATFIEFTFDTGGATVDLKVNYVFASEEYNDFVGSAANDVFGFFIDGNNIAVVPGTTTPVSVNSINSNINPLFFLCNSELFGSTIPCILPPGPYDLAYDGFTTTLTAEVTGLAPGQHTMKIAIGDVGDGAVDSALFLQTESLAVIPVSQPPSPGPGPGPTPNPIPEPSTVLLFGTGLGILGLCRWKGMHTAYADQGAANK